MSMADRDGFIWYDGKLVPWREANTHVLTHSLHYGLAVFEGVRAYKTEIGTAIFRLQEHTTRLFNSAKIYMMEIPYSREVLIEAQREVVRANKLESCYLRPLAFYGSEKMGVSPVGCGVHVAISAWPWGAYLGEDALENGVRIKIASWRRNSQNALPSSAKATGQYINGVLAKIESLKAGYDEAVMLNEQGFITDGSGENLFIVRERRLTTPPISAGCLDGITRETVIALARDLGYEVTEENLVRTDLYNADECFFTGTAAEITPIREVDDRAVGEGHRGPITKELQGAFFAATKGETERHASWLTYVND